MQENLRCAKTAHPAVYNEINKRQETQNERRDIQEDTRGASCAAAIMEFFTAGGSEAFIYHIDL